MLRLLIVLPMLLIGMALLGVGTLVFLPLLAVLPIVLALGAGMFALMFAVGIFAFLMRLVLALIVGVGALAVGGIALGFVFAGGAAVVGIGLLVAHLLLPLLLIVGVIWLIHRAANRPSRRTSRTDDGHVALISGHLCGSRTSFSFLARDFSHPTTGG